jgi:hypothetical protein
MHCQPGWLHFHVRAPVVVPSPCSVCEPVTRSPSLSGWVWLRGGPVGNGVPPTGLWAERGVVLGCSSHTSGGFTGPLPTELFTLTALTSLCVRRPHPPRLDACAVTRLWAECGGVGCRDLREMVLMGTLPTELGLLTALRWLCVRRPHPPCLDTCAVTGLWAERGGGVGCRVLINDGLTGTMPTELGLLNAVYWLCVRRPHPPRLDACAVHRAVG